MNNVTGMRLLERVNVNADDKVLKQDSLYEIRNSLNKPSLLEEKKKNYNIYQRNENKNQLKYKREFSHSDCKTKLMKLEKKFNSILSPWEENRKKVKIIISEK